MRLLEDIEYHADRQLDRALITRLGSCDYIGQKHNVIILGATGSGKTYLASAFGLTANRSFMTVKYVRLPELLGELAIARAEGNYRKLMKSYKTCAAINSGRVAALSAQRHGIERASRDS